MSDASPSPFPTRRRWFQFSLATLFVLVTLCAIFFGWLAREWEIVRHRKVLLGQIEASDANVFTGGQATFKHSPVIKIVRHGDHAFRISKLRQRFGDTSVTDILFRRQLTDADREAVKAFPDADIYAIP
jgi:uncharacterized SAM-binding protein YcdF (DUF218 family)